MERSQETRSDDTWQQLNAVTESIPTTARRLPEPVSLNYRLLPRVARYSPVNYGQLMRRVLGCGRSPVVLHHIALPELPQEVLVMGDDDELEIRVIPAFIDDAVPEVA